MPPPTHDTPSSDRQWWSNRDRRCESNKEKQICNTHQDSSKEPQEVKSKGGTCEGSAEKEYLREKRTAKEAMDAKREKMSSYDIWMEAAKGKRKKSTVEKNAA